MAKPKKLGKLKDAVYFDGFISCDSSDEHFINGLEEEPTGVEVNMHLQNNT